MKHLKIVSFISIGVFLMCFSYSYLKSNPEKLNLLGTLTEIDGIRYSRTGGSVLGPEVRCGDVLHITNCYYEGEVKYCGFDEINGTSVNNGLVEANSLATDPGSCICDDAETNFGERKRYVLNDAYVSGEHVSCGDEVHIATCYKEGGTKYCIFDKKNGLPAVGVVFRNSLATDPGSECNDIDTDIDTYTAYFHEDSYEKDGDGIKCGSTTLDPSFGCYVSAEAGTKVSVPITTELNFKGAKFIGWAADDDGKNVNCSGELVTANKITINEDVNYYACYETEEECVNTKEIHNGKGSYEVKVCYETVNKYGELLVEAKSDEYDEILNCADGYSLDKVSKSNIIETTCKEEGDCYRIYDLTCIGERPKISSKLGIVRDDGYGTITFSANSDAGIKGYYASSYYMKPTKNSEWVLDSRGEYSLESTPGTVFLWAIDNNDQISYAAMTSVIDKVNTDTTLKTLEVKTSSGENLNTESYAFDSSINDGITSLDYVRLSNKLESSSILASGFNPFDTAYKVTTNSSKIAVYATLTSSDASYVSGYEPRTVELDYGVNTILIKIQNKKGKIRTYTIIATREDDRDATNYLKSLTVSEGKLEFNQYTNDYVVSVGKNKNSVSVNGELASLNASYVDGYGPRTIELKNESTTVAIKVKSETGSIRAYTITFVKSGETTENNNEALLSSLSLSKSYVAFDKKVSDYNTTVDYEIDSIDIYALAQDGGDVVSLYRTNNGETEKIDAKNILLNVGANNITIIVSNQDGKSRTYTVNVLRKENGLEISSDTALSMLGVNGYDIEFEPDKLDYEIKIKNEKTLVIAATPMSNRADVYIRGNDNLTAFSIVKIKVVSEDGQFREYTIDIKKDTVNKTIEMIAIVSGVIIIVCGIIIIRMRKRRKSINSYYA